MSLDWCRLILSKRFNTTRINRPAGTKDMRHQRTCFILSVHALETKDSSFIISGISIPKNAEACKSPGYLINATYKSLSYQIVQTIINTTVTFID